MIINLKEAAREKIINTILIDTKDFKGMDLIMQQLNILMIIMITKGNNIIKFLINHKAYKKTKRLDINKFMMINNI